MQDSKPSLEAVNGKRLLCLLRQERYNTEHHRVECWLLLRASIYIYIYMFRRKKERKRRTDEDKDDRGGAKYQAGLLRHREKNMLGGEKGPKRMVQNDGRKGKPVF